MRPIWIKGRDVSRRRTGSTGDGDNSDLVGYPPSNNNEVFVITDDLSPVIDDGIEFVMTDLSDASDFLILTLDGGYMEDGSGNVVVSL